jgi:diaminopimelate epimerase
MRFTKMHGIGNDYVYVNGFEETVPDPVELARRLSDRHRGVGGDGLILLLPPDAAAHAAGAHLRMRIFNADGSEAEMCGNGIRCVCKLAHDRGLCVANPMRVQTGRGVLALTYTLASGASGGAGASGGQVDQVTVDMGEPILEAGRIPVVLPGAAGDPRARLVNVPGTVAPGAVEEQARVDCGIEIGWTAVSMGNPHVVFFAHDLDNLPLAVLGPLIERAPIFPRRINVHFVRVHTPVEVTMRTWERGSGITLACGTGASAVCVAGVLTGRTSREILAHLPGGDLKLEYRQADNHVYMTGPATEVFTGDWPDAT